MDNGAAEGGTCDRHQLSILLRGGLFHEVVAPDRLMDREYTLAEALKMKSFKTDFPDVQIMAVAQGTSIHEVMQCYMTLHAFSWIDVIGLPRVLNEQFGAQSRQRFIESFSNDPDLHGKPIHCLGTNYWYAEEVRRLKQYPVVRSLDTSLPYVLGMHLLDLDDNISTNVKRPKDYFEGELNQRQIDQINDNVARFMKWSLS